MRTSETPFSGSTDQAQALRWEEIEMAEFAEDTPAEFGVLFVGGIGKERPGSAVSALAAALYGWLFRWNRGQACQRSHRQLCRTPCCLLRQVTMEVQRT